MKTRFSHSLPKVCCVVSILVLAPAGLLAVGFGERGHAAKAERKAVSKMVDDLANAIKPPNWWFVPSPGREAFPSSE